MPAVIRRYSTRDVRKRGYDAAGFFTSRRSEEPGRAPWPAPRDRGILGVSGDGVMTPQEWKIIERSLADLCALRRKVAAMPVRALWNGLSNHDHDRILYGAAEVCLDRRTQGIMAVMSDTEFGGERD